VAARLLRGCWAGLFICVPAVLYTQRFDSQGLPLVLRVMPRIRSCSTAARAREAAKRQENIIFSAQGLLIAATIEWVSSIHADGDRETFGAELSSKYVKLVMDLFHVLQVKSIPLMLPTRWQLLSWQTAKKDDKRRCQLRQFVDVFRTSSASPTFLSCLPISDGKLRELVRAPTLTLMEYIDFLNERVPSLWIWKRRLSCGVAAAIPAEPEIC